MIDLLLRHIAGPCATRLRDRTAAPRPYQLLATPIVLVELSFFNLFLPVIVGRLWRELFRTRARIAKAVRGLDHDPPEDTHLPRHPGCTDPKLILASYLLTQLHILPPLNQLRLRRSMLRSVSSYSEGGPDLSSRGGADHNTEIKRRWN